MTDAEMKRSLEKLLDTLPIKQLLKELLYDGFDTYEDYVKYGNAFVQLAPVDKK